MKILLVDDDAFLRDMYATKFGQLGHTIDAADTAESAIAKLSASSYDIILMDMIMPGMNGIELLKKIKEAKLGGSPLCIMLSNQSEEADIRASLEVGAVGYIVKAKLIPSEVVAEVMRIVEGNK
jgi:CheY-like chemotaxis protein